jgi:hypothetical protein
MTRFSIIAMAAVSVTMAFACGDPAPEDSDTGNGGDAGDAGSDTVDDGGRPGNRPPTLARVGDKNAVVERPLVIELRASDPDGDVLSYSLFGDVPIEAKFDKENARFSWTPQRDQLGSEWLITFSVSDGSADDRETITIRVVEQGENAPPEFVDPGDQILAVNQPYELLLEATDPDGDALTYQVIGSIPEGSTFDGSQGLLRWTPTEADEDTTYRLLFEVSDGRASDDLFVNLKVSSAAIVFPPIAPQEVHLGQTLELTLEVQNPAERSLTCQVLGTPPAGATFDTATCVFRWTPTDASLVGRTVQVVFQVSDGEVTLVQTASISVLQAGETAECEPDAYEAVEATDELDVLAAGTYEGYTLCAPDTDEFWVEAQAGQELIVTIAFEHDEADLDLALYSPNDLALAFMQSDGVTDTESVRIGDVPVGGFWLIEVYTVFEGGTGYTITVELGEPPGCVDDSFEENDGQADAAFITPDNVVNGQLCGDDNDWYAFSAEPGQRLEITLTAAGEVDLDMIVFSEEDDDVGWTAVTVANPEVVTVEHLPVGGTYLIEIDSYRDEDSAYTLEVSVSGEVCAPDSQEAGTGDDTPGVATDVEDSTQLTGLTWCDPDYFTVILTTGEWLLASLTYDNDTFADPTVTLTRHETGEAVGTVEPDTGGMYIEIDGAPAEDFYIIGVTEAEVGLTYALDVVVLPAE